VKRREFITLVGGVAAAWPLSTRAQQTELSIGFLSPGSAGPTVKNLTIFRRTLAEAGYVEGRNLTIEYRYAEGRYENLPTLAADLVRRQVSLIVAAGNTDVARAAKAATATIPILFAVGADPAKLGLVASLNHPGGNLTGVNYFLTEVIAKRFGIFREILPDAGHISVLMNPGTAIADSIKQEVTKAASALLMSIDFVVARDSDEIDAAFSTIARNMADAVFVAPDTFLANRSVQIVTLAARHAIPTAYSNREAVEVGGLMSYGPSRSEVYSQLGTYAANILRGANPADLPVVQTTKFELVINLPTAKAIGLTIPASVIATADEVIE
jgi:putative tryptophan/tyrosine transport system substrate-binding protein